MRHFLLPEHMVAWCEQQVALGRAESVGSYLTQLVAQDMGHRQQVERQRAAVAEARESGISMKAPDAILTISTARRLDPRVAAAKTAVEGGRLSGTSLASIDGILARAMQAVLAA